MKEILLGLTVYLIIHVPVRTHLTVVRLKELISFYGTANKWYWLRSAYRDVRSTSHSISLGMIAAFVFFYLLGTLLGYIIKLTL